MANVTRSNVPIDVQALKIFFDGLNASLINVSISGADLVIDVDGEKTITFDFTNNQITVDSVGVTYIDTTDGPYSITVGASTNLFYIQLNDSYNTGRRFIFVYEKIRGHKLFAYNGTGTISTTAVADFYSIASLTFTDIDTLLNYSHGVRISGTISAGYLLYSSDVLFNAGVKDMEDPNFITCSTVVANVVISFDGSNYYSVGANTLLLMDGA